MKVRSQSDELHELQRQNLIMRSAIKEAILACTFAYGHVGAKWLLEEALKAVKTGKDKSRSLTRIKSKSVKPQNLAYEY